MHTVDIILIIVFLVSMIIGYKKGFISALLTWIGLFVSLIMIARFGPMVKAGIMIKFPIGEFFSTVIAYLLIFVLISIFAAILKILLNYLTKLLKLSFINRIIGAVFGFLNCMVILIIFLLITDIIPYTKKINTVTKDSVIISESHKIKDAIKIDLKNKIPAEFLNR